MLNKLFYLCCIIIFFKNIAYPQYFDNNRSANYLSSFNRNSATDSADAIFYNPAGTIMLNPGLHLKIDLINSSDKRQIENNTNKTELESNQLSPAIYLSYNFNKISLFANFTSPNNIFNYHLKDPDFFIGETDTAFTSGTSIAGSPLVFADRAEFTKGDIKFESENYAPLIGIAFKIMNNLSLSTGYSYHKYKFNYSGEATYRFTQDMGAPVQSYLGTETLHLDVENTYESNQFFLGIFYKLFNIINLSTTFKKNKNPEAETKTRINDFSDYPADNNFQDIPDILLSGFNITLFEKLTTGISFSYYLNEYQNKSNNDYEIGIGLKYQTNNNSTLECGYKYTKLNQQITAYEKHLTDNHAIAAGISSRLIDNIKFNFSYAYFFYKNNSVDNYNSNSQESFKRNYYIIAFGVEYGFIGTIGTE